MPIIFVTEHPDVDFCPCCAKFIRRDAEGWEVVEPDVLSGISLGHTFGSFRPLSSSLDPNFSNAKFVNYVFIQTWFVKLKVKSYVYLLYFQLCVVLVPYAPTFVWDFR